MPGPEGMTADDRGVDEVVELLIREQFSDRGIDRLLVERDQDSDGDPVLRITVVVERSPADMDRNTLVGVTRLLRSRLIDASVMAFPVLSFITKSEADKLKIATR